MKKVRYVIDFNLNLFFHLEVISGSVPQRFNEKYASKYDEFRELAKRFKWEFEPQVVSWNFKRSLTTNRNFKNGGKKFSEKLEEIFSSAKMLYKPHWNKIKKKLVSFKEKIEKKKREIEILLEKIEKFTGIYFPLEIINIYLVEALAEEYKIGAEPLHDGIAIGPIKNWNLMETVITHEFIHLNAKDKIIQLIPPTHEKDRDKITEALTVLITSSVLGKNTFQKKTFYTKLFQPFFLKIKKIDNFENFISKMFAQTLLVKGD